MNSESTCSPITTMTKTQSISTSLNISFVPLCSQPFLHLVSRNHLYQLTRTAITKYHRLSSLPNINLSPQFWSLEVQNESLHRVSSWFHTLRSMREGSFPGLSPCLVDGCLLPMSLCTIFPLCISLSKFSSFIKTSIMMNYGPPQ